MCCIIDHRVLIFCPTDIWCCALTIPPLVQRLLHPPTPPANLSSIPTDLIDKEYSHLLPFLHSPIHPPVRSLLPCSHDVAQLSLPPPPPPPSFTLFVKGPQSVKNAQQLRARLSSRSHGFMLPRCSTAKSLFICYFHSFGRSFQVGVEGVEGQEHSAASSILQAGSAYSHVAVVARWLLVALRSLKVQGHPVLITV